jgi:hypothetical protein
MTHSPSAGSSASTGPGRKPHGGGTGVQPYQGLNQAEIPAPRGEFLVDKSLHNSELHFHLCGARRRGAESGLRTRKALFPRRLPASQRGRHRYQVA